MTLKPCPFCGDQTPNIQPPEEDGPSGWYWVHCTTCYTDGPLHETREKAAEGWNTRKSSRKIKPSPLAEEEKEELD